MTPQYLVFLLTLVKWGDTIVVVSKKTRVKGSEVSYVSGSKEK